MKFSIDNALAFCAVAFVCGCGGKHGPDSTVPTITVTSPAAGETVAASSVMVTGSVGDAGHNLNSVKVSVGTLVVDAAINSSAGTFSAAVTGIPDGSATIVATAIDRGGHAASTAPIEVLVDATPPTVEILTPIDGAVLGPSEGLALGTSLELTVFVALDDGAGTGTDGQVVAVADDQTTLATVTATNGSAVLLVALTPGTHSLHATVTDLAGHQGVSTAVAWLIDLAPPTISIASPTDTRIGLAETNGGSSGNINVQVLTNAGTGRPVTLLDNGLVAATLPAGASSVTFTDVALFAGSNTFTATVEDPEGNLATSAGFTTVYDPACAITLTRPVSALTRSASVEVTVSTDAEDGQIVTFSGGAATVEATVNAGTATATIELSEGVNALAASVADLAGNPATVNANLRLDTTSPLTAITSPGDGAFYTSADDEDPATSRFQKTVTIAASDAGGSGVSTVSFTINGRPSPVSATLIGGVAQAVLDLLDGSNEILATVTDAAGNTATSSPIRLQPTVGKVLTLNGVVRDDAGNGVADARIELGRNLLPTDALFGRVVASAVSDANGNYSVAVPPGPYIMRGGRDVDVDGDFFGMNDDLGVKDVNVLPAGIGNGDIVIRPATCTVTGTVSDDVSMGVDWGGTRTFVGVRSGFYSLDGLTIATNGTFTVAIRSGGAQTLFAAKDTDGDGKFSTYDAYADVGTVQCGDSPAVILPPPGSISGVARGASGFDVFGFSTGFGRTRVQPDGSYRIVLFAAPGAVSGVLPMLEGLSSGGLLGGFGGGFAGIDLQPSTFGVAGDVTDLDFSVPEVRLVTGSFAGVDDFRALASDLNGNFVAQSWIDPGTHDYILRTAPALLRISALEDHSGFDGQYYFAGITAGQADARTGDADTGTFTVPPLLTLESVTGTDIAGGPRANILDPGDDQLVSVQVRNDGGPILAGSAQLSLNFGDLTLVADQSSIPLSLTHRESGSFTGFEWTLPGASPIGDVVEVTVHVTDGGNPVSPDLVFRKLAGGVLLVDDDGSSDASLTPSSHDVHASYAAALAAAGLDYDVHEVGLVTAQGPLASEMATYGETIWITGDRPGTQTVSASDETEIRAYLDAANGRFVLFSSGFSDAYDSAPGDADFEAVAPGTLLADVFQIQLVSANSPTAVTFEGGVGPFTSGTYSLLDPTFVQHPDLFGCTNPVFVTEYGDPNACMGAGVGAAASSSTAFFSFGAEGMTDPASRTELMKRLSGFF